MKCFLGLECKGEVSVSQDVKILEFLIIVDMVVYCCGYFVNVLVSYFMISIRIVYDLFDLLQIMFKKNRNIFIEKYLCFK